MCFPLMHYHLAAVRHLVSFLYSDCHCRFCMYCHASVAVDIDRAVVEWALHCFPGYPIPNPLLNFWSLVKGMHNRPSNATATQHICTIQCFNKKTPTFVFFGVSWDNDLIDHLRSGVIFNFEGLCLSFCLCVCQMITFESLDISSYFHIWCISKEYRSGSYTKVMGSRSRSHEQ